MKLGNRSVLTLGIKDAFHAPSVVVSSRQSLRAGDSVKFISEACVHVEVCDRGERHGIVDPFGPAVVYADVPVWMLLEPSLVGDLSHHFTINVPIVKEEVPTAKPERQGWTDDIPEEERGSDWERCRHEGC